MGDNKSTEWRLKAKVDCSRCNGKGDFSYAYKNKQHFEACPDCDGSGKVIELVEPAEIPRFLHRPESIEYVCVCKKTEIILRPQLNQLPNGWVNWSGDLLCATCKTLAVYDALMAAADKVRQIKEKYFNDEQDEEVESNLAD